MFNFLYELFLLLDKMQLSIYYLFHLNMRQAFQRYRNIVFFLERKYNISMEEISLDNCKNDSVFVLEFFTLDPYYKFYTLLQLLMADFVL